MINTFGSTATGFDLRLPFLKSAVFGAVEVRRAVLLLLWRLMDGLCCNVSAIVYIL